MRTKSNDCQHVLNVLLGAFLPFAEGSLMVIRPGWRGWHGSPCVTPPLVSRHATLPVFDLSFSQINADISVFVAALSAFAQV